jgi:PAS domain S-box-containing protein
MKLQEKTSIILIILLIIIIVMISIFVSVVSMSSYNALEHKYALQDVDQALNRLHDDETSLESIVADWGPWDDTYDFVNGNKPDYISRNLFPEAYKNLGVDLVVITNRNGQIVYAGEYDDRNNTMVTLPASLGQVLTPANPLLSMSDPHNAAAGIVLLDGQPLIAASRPIVHTDYSGTPQGVVIMGRYLDDKEISYLSKLSKLNIHLARVDDPGLPGSLLASLRTITDGSPGIVIPVNNSQIAGYSLIRDVNGNDALILEILQPRDIYQQGLTSTYQYILIVLAAGLLFGVVILLILDRLVLSRLNSLSLQVHNIGIYTSASQRIQLDGNDEFSALSLEINRMLDTIGKTHEGLMQSEARFRELTGFLPQIIFEMDIQGNILYVNKAGAEQFGVTEQMIGQGTNISRFLSPDNITQMQRGLAAVMAGSPSPGEIYSLQRPMGSAMKAIVSTSLIKKEGTITGFRGIVVDVTERVELEEALTESREYLQTLFSSVKVGILVIDAETHLIMDANPAALEMIEAARGEVLKQSCHRFICTEEDGQCPITDHHQNMDNTERELLTSGGRKISIIKHVVRIRLQGRPCLLETFIDNTIRKQIEHELRESTDLLTGILQASPVGVYRMDPSGHISFINDTFTQITGIPLDTIRGRYWADILPGQERNRILGELAEVIRDRRKSSAEVRYIHPDGTPYWLFGQTVPINDKEGNLSGWVGTITDITGQKLIEDALKESEEQYRALTENTPDILFSTDMTGILTYVSPQVGKYGFIPEEVVGRTLQTFIHPADIARVEDNLNQALKKSAQFVSQFRILDKWGNIKWFEEKSSLRLDLSGRPIGIYGILRDVTERKRVEDAIDIANKKLNLLNQITRHDILNTITGLLGCVDMAKATHSSEEKEQLLNDIRDLTRVIQRHITFTREYQEVGIHLPQWQNVNDIINKVLQNFVKSGITFRSEFEKTEIYADPLLEKVFYNLVDNAIRYGSTITIISIYPNISDRGFSLVFEDNGVGVEPGQKSEIFKRGVGKNTGMGLFLTAEILAITGISIEENGIFGKGARFELRIPNGTWRLHKD